MDRARSDGTAVIVAPREKASDYVRGATVDWVMWAIVGLGIGLRLLRYWQGRSLWLDEVFLANNLIHKSAWGLLGKLDYRQGAPPLFLLACKGAVKLFGNSEYALRLVPLLAGLISVPLFYLLARRTLKRSGLIAALLLFAVLEPLIYYSSEVKQYSTDVAVMLAILLAVIRLHDHPQRRGALLGLFVVGFVGLFLSHPAIFVLAGGVVWLLTVPRIDREVALRKPGYTRGLIWNCAGWGIAFVADYVLFLRPLADNMGLQNYWVGGYPPVSVGIIPWFGTRAIEIFAGYDTMWLKFAHIGAWPAYAAMVLAGIGIAFSGGFIAARSSRGVKALVLWPIAVTLIAAILRRYPFSDRLILFLVPLFVLLIGAGVAAMWGKMNPRIIGSILIAIVAVPTVGRAALFAARPPGREEIRPALAYLKNHWQPGDLIYVYHAADAPYLYYRGEFGLGGAPFIAGQRPADHPNAFAHDLHLLAGHRRVWVLFSHVWVTQSGDERIQFVHLLQSVGQQRDQFSAPGVWLYRFRLN